MNDYDDYWDMQEQEDEEYEAQQLAIDNAYENGYQKGRDEALDILLHVDHQMYGIVVDKMKKEEEKE